MNELLTGMVEPLDRTRLAPSPTGALHLGNARTFLANWLLARQSVWRIALRIEDLDGPRIKRGADQQAIEDLHWLGLDWNEGPIYQSGRSALYAQAIEKLLASGQAYACVCSRKDVDRAASAPHPEDGAAVYPGTCRGRFRSVAEGMTAVQTTGQAVAIRFQVSRGTITWNDGFHGELRADPLAELGDFVIAKAIGSGSGVSYQAAYQLAVVVDDAAMGITRVVRGDDLLDSTPRQRLIYQALGLETQIPRYIHLPLVIGTDGRRLAKRHGDTRLSYYRERGVAAGRVRALLARWLGIDDVGDDADAKDLVALFDLRRVPREPIIFTEDDDRWLRGA